MFAKLVASRYRVLASGLATPKQTILDKLAAGQHVRIEQYADGTLYDMEDPAAPREAPRIGLWLNGQDHTFHGSALVGDKIKPAAQQLLQTLVREGIVDRGWKLAPDKVRFKAPERDFDFLLDPRNRYARSLLHLKLYHGTSSVDYEQIQRKGLMPLFVGSNQQHGFESRVKHGGNEKVLYLASTPEKAHDYAKSRVHDVMRIATKQGRKTAEWSGQHYLDGQEVLPVVLEVQIPDIANLVADDDHVNALAREIGRKLWDAKSPDEQQRTIQKMRREHPEYREDYTWRDPSLVVMIWRETDEGFAEIMQHVPKTVYREWFESLTSRDQVGYRGVIPPKFIKKIEPRW